MVWVIGSWAISIATWRCRLSSAVRLPIRAGVLALPQIHRLVTIVDQDGREYCSRIEDVAPSMLVVARPLTLPVEHCIAPDSPLEVRWPDPAGLTIAPVRLRETVLRDTLGLWVTELDGELFRQQRRRFVRVSALGQLELMTPSGTPFAHVAGYLLDVSEAALRCLLSAPDAELVGEATELLASFEFAGIRSTLPVSVLRAERSRRDENATELVLTFDLDERQSGLLRKQIFDEQLRARQRR